MQNAELRDYYKAVLAVRTAAGNLDSPVGDEVVEVLDDHCCYLQQRLGIYPVDPNNHLVIDPNHTAQ